MSSSPESHLYADLESQLNRWVSYGVAAMTDPEEDLIAYEDPDSFSRLQTLIRTEEDRDALNSALKQILFGQLHSFLVTLDGGTKMAEQQTLRITTDAGDELSDSLHEGFVGYHLDCEEGGS